MDLSTIGDQLHRVVKMAIDSGEVTSLDEAKRLFVGYRLLIEVGPDVATSPTLQAALLTAVNTGRRCFLGGVQVTGGLDVPLYIPWRRCHTLGEAIIDLQGEVSTETFPEIPRIVIGDVREEWHNSEFGVRATFNGWSGGVVPLACTHRLEEAQEFIPSGVLAGALAVSEAFQFVRGNSLAGHREVGLSLWQPEGEVSWLDCEEGPSLEVLPSRLWLIGLGHLGQAYLWTLGFLPYASPGDVQLVLQDFDTLVSANDSTSPLTTPTIIGEKKTRSMARWCEMRGFQTTIVERRFADNFQISGDDPQVALCGVDNLQARALLEGVGFRRIIEAGLGRGTQEYLAFQVHSFPASRAARECWKAADSSPVSDKLLQQPAYKALAANGLDRCGLTLLADRAVGASFVGTATASVVIAELLRTIMGAHRYELVDGNLGSLSHRQAIRCEQISSPFNPGSTRAGTNKTLERT